MEEKELIQRDLLLIIKISRKLNCKDPKTVKELYEHLVRENMFYTQLGKDYLLRLKCILDGEENNDLCFICKKNNAENHAICPNCLSKISQLQTEKKTEKTETSNSNTYSETDCIGQESNNKEVNSKEVNSKEAYNKEADSKGTDNKGTDSKGTDSKSTDSKSTDSKSTDSKEDLFNSEATKKAKEAVKKGYSSLVSSVNKMTGESGEVKFSLRDLVSNVFCKHTKSEEEHIFIAGTEMTTPKEADISSEWPKPWLYSRVLFILFVVYFTLLTTYNQFHAINLLPGLMFMGALAVPFSGLIFFWELNVPRNISIIEVVKVFFVGGVLSLTATLFIDQFLVVKQLDFTGALLTGIAEETGKGLIVLYYLRKPKYKYILNGLLIGAAVGAGFAVFETAGYAFNSILISNTLDATVSTLTMRGLLAMGGHIMWSALIGAGIVIVKKEEELQKQHVLNANFIKFWAIAVILHAIWDSPIVHWFPELGGYIPVVYLVLIVLVWIIVLTIVSAGLRQVARIVNDAILLDK